MSGSRVIFYYDVVCPFAYMASRLVEAMAQRTGADIVWRPVLLGKFSHSSPLSSPFLLSSSLLHAAYRRYIRTDKGAAGERRLSDRDDVSCQAEDTVRR